MSPNNITPVERNCRRLTTVHVLQHVSHASTSCMHPGESLGFAKTRCVMEAKIHFWLLAFFCKGAEGSVNQDRYWQEDWALKQLDSIHDLLCASGINVSAMALGRCDMIWWPVTMTLCDPMAYIWKQSFTGVWIPKLKYGPWSDCSTHAATRRAWQQNKYYFATSGKHSERPDVCL